MSPWVIAHRGASADAPENTIEAFELAIEQGADMIETDLHLLRDGAIALHHDEVVARKRIGRLALAELREIQPTIPTLEEALDACGERIAFNLEIKRPRGGPYPGLEKRTLDELRRRGLLGRTLFSSFGDDVLATLRSLEPSVRIGLLVSSRPGPGIVRRAECLGAEAIHLHVSIATRRRIDSLHGAGYRVYVYTVDDPARQMELMSLGVEGLFTNRPGELVAMRARKERARDPGVPDRSQ